MMYVIDLPWTMIGKEIGYPYVDEKSLAKKLVSAQGQHSFKNLW